MSKRIVIVHADEQFTEALVSALHTAMPDVDLTPTSSGTRALTAVEEFAPDLVIVDADLDGLDGFILCEQLKNTDATRSVPVVIVAASPNEACALRARQVGASAYLASTGQPGSIAGKVATILEAQSGGAFASPSAAPAAIPVIPGTPEDGSTPEEPVESAAAEVDLSDLEDFEPVRESMGGRETNPTVDVASSASGVDAPVVTVAPPSASAASAGYGVPMPVAPEASAPGASGDGEPVVTGPASLRGPETGGVPHIDDLLRLMLQRGGSDLHITVGSAPGIRQRGELIAVEDLKPLTPRDTMEMVFSLLSEEQRRRYETELELDFAYSIPGVSRFRANVFQQRDSVGAVFRVIPIKIPTMEDLSLPRVCKYLAERPRGLVVVTGPTGSGKSTTLAAMIDHINTTRAVHIITLEDPIEFMHRNKKSFVNQREIGEDTHSFSAALKRVLRQDPDVILVGEMRDLETISAAITAAETGHLVLATLHTTGGPETVDRIIDVFPPHQQQQVRMQLSNTLEGVLSQVLLRSTDGRSRVLAMEIMLGIPAISNLIREGKTHQMDTIIQGGAQLGMQTLDHHLKNLLTQGKITYEEAISKAKSPRELAEMLGRKL